MVQSRRPRARVCRRPRRSDYRRALSGSIRHARRRWMERFISNRSGSIVAFVLCWLIAIGVQTLLHGVCLAGEETAPPPAASAAPPSVRSGGLLEESFNYHRQSPMQPARKRRVSASERLVRLRIPRAELSLGLVRGGAKLSARDSPHRVLRRLHADGVSVRVLNAVSDSPVAESARIPISRGSCLKSCDSSYYAISVAGRC